MVQLDGEGHILKAGFTDFEQAEVLTEKSRKGFDDPLVPDYDILTKIISYLSLIYSKKGFPCPEVLKEGFYKAKGDSMSGLGMFGRQYLEPIKELDKDSPTYLQDFKKILQPYAAFEHIPTKTLEEIITELEKS
jgi:hypothetical protein